VSANPAETAPELVRPMFGRPYEIPDPSPAEGPDPYGNPEPEPEWLRVDWREHLHTVDVDGAEITYVDCGASEAGELELLLVHGLSGCWQNWLETIPHFARTRRVVALDLPGFGHSPMPEWEPTIKAYGHFLHEFRHAVGIGDCCVVGNSMGGFVAAEGAIARPDRFEKLVLVSAAGVSSVDVRREPAQVIARMLEATAPLTIRLQERTFKRPGLRSTLFQGVFDRPDELRPELLWEQLANGAGRPGFLEALTNLLGYDILDRLEEVEVPTLIVWGRHDRVVPSADAAEWAERLRNSRTVILDRTGHAPQLERPVRFNRLLEDFVTKTP
jgi:pimeloyl-ACP methyl ester carboxylesterase